MKDGLVDLFAVDRHRKRMSEPLILEEPPPFRIQVVHVRIKRHLGTFARDPAQNPVTVSLLAFLQESVVGECKVVGLQITFAASDLCRNKLPAGYRHRDLIDIGKLFSVRVDAMEIRVPVENIPV